MPVRWVRGGRFDAADQALAMIHRFGPFEYDTEQRLLFRDGEMAPLVPKAIDTLHALLDRRGRIVEKADLIKLVWPDTVVEDVGLARNISLLRKALGDEGAESCYIETVPRRGYRFVAAAPEVPPPLPVTAEGVATLPGRGIRVPAAPEVLSPPPPGPTPTEEVPTPPARRIRVPAAAAVAGVILALAVLVYWQFYVPSRFLKGGAGVVGVAVVPFESLTPGQSPTGFATGLSDSLVSNLSKLEGLQVVSQSTVRRYNRLGISMSLMARVLGLEVLVEGAVRGIGDSLRISARLVDVHTGKVIWSETYDRPAADPGQAESQVAAEVAAQVGAHLAIHQRFPSRR